MNQNFSFFFFIEQRRLNPLSPRISKHFRFSPDGFLLVAAEILEAQRGQKFTITGKYKKEEKQENTEIPSTAVQFPPVDSDSLCAAIVNFPKDLLCELAEELPSLTAPRLEQLKESGTLAFLNALPAVDLRHLVDFLTHSSSRSFLERLNGLPQGRPKSFGASLPEEFSDLEEIPPIAPISGRKSNGPNGLAKARAAPPELWNSRSRELFKNFLLYFGLERLDRVHEALEKEGIPVTRADVDAASRSFLYSLQEYFKTIEPVADLFNLLEGLAPFDENLTSQPDFLQIFLFSNWKTIKKYGDGWVRRLDQMKTFNELVTIGLDDLLKEIAPLQTRGPAEWWGQQQDEELIRGILVHGLGNFDAIKADTNYSFHQILQQNAMGRTEAPWLPGDSADAKEDGEESSDRRSWPSTLSLVTRFKQLLRVLKLQAEAAKAKKKKEKTNKEQKTPKRKKTSKDSESLGSASPADREESAKRRKSSHPTVWTARQRSRFLALLAVHGRPMAGWQDFTRTKEIKAKSEEECEEFLKTIVSECQAICAAATGEGAATAAPSAEDEEGRLTASQAETLLGRLALFADVRSLTSEELEFSDFSFSPEESPGLPNWWRSPQHDKQLLRCLRVHGLQLDIFRNSSEYSFHESGKITREQLGAVEARARLLVSQAKGKKSKEEPSDKKEKKKEREKDRGDGEKRPKRPKRKSPDRILEEIAHAAVAAAPSSTFEFPGLPSNEAQQTQAIPVKSALELLAENRARLLPPMSTLQSLPQPFMGLSMPFGSFPGLPSHSPGRSHQQQMRRF